ncbi:hypothetical protein BDA96_03G409600 [Sorghum bicolor]|uniref:Uncharacterized protein n=2 Tax=Sorghum bicolor TaxID=4558 RepID=A0A921RHM7_SORBI|nr:hypothetical protein BDA96_03G409600 [Sorghum bicolor]KAG0540444.1 hypothetical protein BDA96_03G409600 [Sorghum bicolor]OQU87992.1 hypothetical protein SORBI_3003G379450 [Sorghum bicolor]OQU87993.1 hypothetical protein SORBI_3003G379450 [Sorghum bicolor]OQU87994.1 hypothetical protein SORBI_3003G379450 [Sorghum bicolor]
MPQTHTQGHGGFGGSGWQPRLCCNLGHGGGLGCGPSESISVVLVAHHDTCLHVGLKWMVGSMTVRGKGVSNPQAQYWCFCLFLPVPLSFQEKNPQMTILCRVCSF